MNARLALAIARYIPSALIALAADFLAILLAWIAALPIFITVDAKGREHIAPFWRWITTHDALIDEFFRGSYFTRHWFLSRFSRDEIMASGFLRYVGRVCWVWRNPAYQVSHWLGYDQRGVEVPADRFKDPLWDTGLPNRAFWSVTNDSGQVGFLYQRQWYYTDHRCIEMQFGWKLYRRDPDQRCMLALRFSPFKRYGA